MSELKWNKKVQIRKTSPHRLGWGRVYLGTTCPQARSGHREAKKKKKTVCTTRYSSAALGLLMRNPIVSGSTDLWQRVWMFYSERSGGPGSRRMSAGLQMGHSVPRCRKNPSTCPSKVEKAGVHGGKSNETFLLLLLFFFLPLRRGGTLCNWLKLAFNPLSRDPTWRGREMLESEIKKSTTIEDCVWTSCHSSRLHPPCKCFSTGGWWPQVGRGTFEVVASWAVSLFFLKKKKKKGILIIYFLS